MPKVCVIGHLTRDIIRIGGKVQVRAGGVAYYFSLAFKSLGGDVEVLTKLAKKDLGLLKELKEASIPTLVKESATTTIFENIYETLDRRVQRVKAIAEPFNLEELRSLKADLFHLGPLTQAEVPPAVLFHLAKIAPLSLDVQGYLRKVRGEKVIQTSWNWKDEGLAKVSIVKLDEREARILSGERELKRAARRIASWGPQEILITLGSKGSLIYHDGRLCSIPAYPPSRIVDPTGCGDTYVAGYLFKRLKGAPLEEAGKFAAGVASLKLTQWGAFKEKEEEVYRFLKQFKATSQR
jgi:sugar/nucleoside kinase (ribokinase family)